jgi:hypothetical protein
MGIDEKQESAESPYARSRPELAASGLSSEHDRYYYLVTPTGLEHAQETLEKQGFGGPGGAESGALSDDSGSIDPELARVVAVWPTLPEGVRRAVLALVQQARSHACAEEGQ